MCANDEVGPRTCVRDALATHAASGPKSLALTPPRASNGHVRGGRRSGPPARPAGHPAAGRRLWLHVRVAPTFRGRNEKHRENPSETHVAHVTPHFLKTLHDA